MQWDRRGLRGGLLRGADAGWLAARVGVGLPKGGALCYMGDARQCGAPDEGFRRGEDMVERVVGP